MSIICQLCGRELELVSCSHLKYKHDGMTMAEYRKEFPDAPLETPEVTQRRLSPEPIIYTITCPNCGKEKKFEKKTPNSYERKFCNRSCANSYNTRERWVNPEFRQATIISMTEKWAEPEHKQKMIDAANTPERNEKLRTSLAEYWAGPGRHEEASQRIKDLWENNPEYRKVVSAHNQERWEDSEYREMMLEAQTIAANKPERKQQLSKITTALWKDPNFRQKVMSAIQQAKNTPEHKQKLQELWADSEWATRQIQKMAAGRHIKPNRPETKLLHLLNGNSYPYVYIGNFSLWIGGKNPDFIWPEKRLLIEMFGSYWHDESEVESRIELFVRHGFDTLIIWDYELGDTEQLLVKLKEFHSSTD